jgi:hypothetical protein
MKNNSFIIDNIKYKCDELGLIYVNHYVEKDSKNKHRYYVQFVCNKHPTVGVQINEWSHLVRSKYACRICSGKYKNISEFILGNTQINSNVNILSEYSGFNNSLQCECNICKHIWKTTPHSLKNGSGCPECGRRKAGLSKRMSHDEYVIKVYNNNPHIEVISQYLTLKDPVTCQCKIDGTVFVVSSADNLLYENVQCPYCSTSKSEQLIIDILNKYNYDYEFHYRFDDCKHIHTLEFDFAIFHNNNLLCLVEYDGEQHFKPIDFAGKGELWALQQLHITQRRDQIKTDYCLKNNIPLIRIPYWERQNLEHYLLSQLDNVCNIAV